MLAAAALLAATPGCFLDRSGLGASPERDAGPGLDAAFDATVRDGAVRDGSWVDAANDADRDGVPTSEDCDDSDPSVGRMAERACDSACASGVERCTSGVWAACDAPTDCSCVGAETRTLTCAQCGTQNQRCESGGWVDDGTCMDQGACAMGATEMGSEACGLCGSGTHSRVRECNASCEWDPWTDWGVCSGESGCAPGTVENESMSCGTCATGSQTRTRTCDVSCAWGAWTDWSMCSATTECTPGAMETDTQSCGGCGRGTHTRTRTCDTGCTWGAWSAFDSCSGDVSCRDLFGTDYCPCARAGSWTCCPTGDWSSWRGSCAGCP